MNKILTHIYWYGVATMCMTTIGLGSDVIEHFGHVLALAALSLLSWGGVAAYFLLELLS